MYFLLLSLCLKRKYLKTSDMSMSRLPYQNVLLFLIPCLLPLQAQGKFAIIPSTKTQTIHSQSPDESLFFYVGLTDQGVFV